MTSRLIALLLLAVSSGISAQDIVCPQGSSLRTDITVFTVSSSPKPLGSTLGNFYSDSWQYLLKTPITFTPALLSRTLHFAPESLDITEILESSTPSLLQWELSSGPFVLPSSDGNVKVLSYNQSLSLLPVCYSDSYTTVIWSIHACISLPSEGQEEEKEPINWFKLQHHKAVRNMFSTVSRGWFGPVSTDKKITACPADIRDPVVSAASDASEVLKERVVVLTPAAITGTSSSISVPPETGYPIPTTTYSTSYPILPLPVTVSMPPANATWRTVGAKSVKTSASTSTISMATYIPGNGATGRSGVEFMVVVAAIGGLLFV